MFERDPLDAIRRTASISNTDFSGHRGSSLQDVNVLVGANRFKPHCVDLPLFTRAENTLATKNEMCGPL